MGYFTNVNMQELLVMFIIIVVSRRQQVILISFSGGTLHAAYLIPYTDKLDHYFKFKMLFPEKRTISSAFDKSLFVCNMLNSNSLQT